MEAVASPTPRGGRWRHVTERRGFLATFLISPAVLFIGALVGGPLILAIYLSFTDATAGSLSGHWVGLRNFRAEIHNPVFVDAVWHTFLFTVISQLIVIVCAGLLAHALIKSFRGKWILRFFILLPWAAPVALTTIGFLWFFDPTFSIFNWILHELHLIGSSPPNWLGTPRNAMASIITVHAWRILPFATVIFLAGIASIPKEVDDAAAIDAATGLKKFWYVSLPLQLPIATVALEVSSTSEPMRMACAEVFSSWVEAAAERMAAAGLARERSRQLAISMLASLEGAFVLARALRSTEPVEVAGAAATDAVREAVAERRASRRARR